MTIPPTIFDNEGTDIKCLTRFPSVVSEPSNLAGGADTIGAARLSQPLDDPCRDNPDGFGPAGSIRPFIHDSANSARRPQDHAE